MVPWRPLSYVAVVVAAIAGVYLYGEVKYEAGQKDIVATLEKHRVNSIARKDAIDEEVSKLTGDELFKRALELVQP